MPTFHKHAGQIISGLQIHVDDESYDHEAFKPYRVIALWLKAIRHLYPDYAIWRDFHYEYEKTRLAIDLINGGPNLREWVDSSRASVDDFDAVCVPDEMQWLNSREDVLLYF
jgi:uncharacterized protein YbbC (DUF1343 family)